MKKIITLLFFCGIALIPISESSQAQVNMSDLAENQVCATDACDVRLTQWTAFSIQWELKTRCFIDGQWETATYTGDGVYSGSLCNGAISYQG